MRTGLLWNPWEFPSPFKSTHTSFPNPQLYVFFPPPGPPPYPPPIYNLSTTIWAAHILLATGSFPEVWLSYQEFPHYKRIGSPSPRSRHMSLASQSGVGASGPLPTPCYSGRTCAVIHSGYKPTSVAVRLYLEDTVFTLLLPDLKLL